MTSRFHFVWAGWLILAAGFGVTASVCPHSAAAATVIVPFGDCGWELSGPTYVGTNPRAVCAPIFAPWWCPGETGGTLLQGSCCQYFLTRHIRNEGPDPVFATATARGLGGIQVNIDGGYSGGSFPEPSCPLSSSYQIAQGGWLHHGDNIIRIDFVMLPASGVLPNVGGFIDGQITAEVPLPVRTVAHSWGSLKVVYR